LSSKTIANIGHFNDFTFNKIIIISSIDNTEILDYEYNVLLQVFDD